MKKSELKSIIKEAMMEILPELMEIMAENINESYTPSNTVMQKPDLTLVRQHYSDANGNNGNTYDGMGGQPSRAVAPNPKAMVDGEHFASGKNIMEWFNKEHNNKPAQREFTHSDNQMADYMKEKFGV